MVRLFVCMGILLVFNAKGQNRVIDSLQSALENARQNTKEQVDLLNSLSYEYYDYNDSIGIHYANEGLRKAQSLKYTHGIKYSYLLLGIGYMGRCDYSKALQNYKRSVRQETTEKYSTDVYAWSLMGNVFRDQGQYDSARWYYDQARKNFSKSENYYHGIHYKNVANLQLRLWNNKVALEYLDSASSFITKSVSSLDAWSLYGLAYQNMAQFEKAKTYFNKVCSVSEQSGDYYYQIKCLLNKIQSSYRAADYLLAIRYGLTALKLMENYTYPPQKVELLTRMGEVYSELSEYAIASKYLFQALQTAERYGLQYEIAYVYGELAWIYKDQGNLDLAFSYLDKSQAIRESIGDKYGVAVCHNIRGLVFLIQKELDKSIAEHQRAQELRKQINHPGGVAASIFNISLVYIERNQIDKALDLQLQAVSIEERLDNKQSLAISYDFIASLYLKKKNLDKAEEYLKKCRALALQTNSKLLLRNNCGYFAELYEAKGDLSKALEFRKLYQQLNDSIYSTASAGKLAEMEALYQLDKKEEQIKSLSQEKELQESKIALQQISLRQQRIIIAAATLGLLFFGGFIFFMFRYNRQIERLNSDIIQRNKEIQKQAEELQTANQSLKQLNNEILEKTEEIQAQSEELMEANNTILEVNRTLEIRVEDRTQELRQAYKELDTFFYRASHDFRRPLTTFMGLAEVAKITVKDTNALELFSKVNDTAHYLDKMLVKLQSISDLGGQELVYKEVFFKEIFDQVADSYREQLGERNIRVIQQVDVSTAFYSYPAMVKIIIENLFENSIFFSGGTNSFISLKAFSDGASIVLQVGDNGEGIPLEYQDRIFEMYFRANERSKGNGLGLYIVSKAVEKLQGSISLSSELHKGTVFTLQFPDRIAM